MLKQTKTLLKRALASIGLYHPALGVKLKSEAKGDALLAHKRPELEIFVETGTYQGEMIERMRDHFKKIYSVEMDTTLYENARRRFEGDGRIVLMHGDSALQIGKILTNIHEPALFWLDAHATGAITMLGPHPAPIEREVQSIMAHPVKEHVILIDDARLFDRYSINRLKSLAKKNGYRYALKDGLFRLYGPASTQ